MLEVRQAQLVGVVAEVDRVHVPGNLLPENRNGYYTVPFLGDFNDMELGVMVGPVGHVVVVAVAGVLGGEAPAGPHVLEVQGLHLQHRGDPLHGDNLDLNQECLLSVFFRFFK